MQPSIVSDYAETAGDDNSPGQRSYESFDGDLNQDGQTESFTSSSSTTKPDTTTTCTCTTTTTTATTTTTTSMTVTHTTTTTTPEPSVSMAAAGDHPKPKAYTNKPYDLPSSSFTTTSHVLADYINFGSEVRITSPRTKTSHSSTTTGYSSSIFSHSSTTTSHSSTISDQSASQPQNKNHQPKPKTAFMPFNKNSDDQSESSKITVNPSSSTSTSPLTSHPQITDHRSKPSFMPFHYKSDHQTKSSTSKVNPLNISSNRNENKKSKSKGTNYFSRGKENKTGIDNRFANKNMTGGGDKAGARSNNRIFAEFQKNRRIQYNMSSFVNQFIYLRSPSDIENLKMNLTNFIYQIINSGSLGLMEKHSGKEKSKNEKSEESKPLNKEEVKSRVSNFIDKSILPRSLKANETKKPTPLVVETFKRKLYNFTAKFKGPQFISPNSVDWLEGLKEVSQNIPPSDYIDNKEREPKTQKEKGNKQLTLKRIQPKIVKQINPLYLVDSNEDPFAYAFATDEDILTDGVKIGSKGTTYANV